MHLTQLAKPSAAYVIAFGLIACLLLPTSPKAEPNPKAAVQFHIPKQKLTPALTAFAEQSGVQLLYNAELAEALSTSGINGSYAPQQALSTLLKGSGIGYRYVDKNIITLERQPKGSINGSALLPVAQATANADNNAGSDTTLPKVTVEADADQAYDPDYYADPYNKDYVLPNATVGTKTDTPVMETPLNVQVISKQVLKDRQVIRLADSLKNVSGVTTNNTGGGNAGFAGGTTQTFFLRGFESKTFFRNGFRLQEGTASKGLANVESVEVLKGPAAILYGLVEPGGMVNVVTKQPLATPYYGFTQQFGSYDLYRTTFDATGPITKNKDLLYRVNMSYENSGSFREFVGKEDVFFAPVLKWNIGPKTQATFELEYNHQHLGMDAGFVPLLNGKILDVPRSRNYGEYSPATTETIFGGFNWSHQFNDDWAIKHRFSVNQLRVSPEIFVFPFLVDQTDVTRLGQANETQNNTYSTNLDLTGHFDTLGLKHTLLLGGDYYRLYNLTKPANSSPNTSTINLLNPNHPGIGFDSLLPIPGSVQTEQFDQYGLYIQDQIKLPYNVHVMGGIRYQYIHQKTDFGEKKAQTQDAVTPRVGILWRPKSWLSLYANYVESFGANSGTVFPNKTIPPTSAEQYEGGIKAEFFGGKLRANLAYFDLTKTNVAAADPDKRHICPGGCSIAIGAVRSRGPELDITGEILPGWNIIATWSNTDIRVTKTNADNESINGAGVGGRFPNVPRNVGTLWSTYEVQDGDLKGLSFGGGATLRDGQHGFGDSPPAKIPGYATFDLMAGYDRQVGDAKISVQFNINNLLDKHYFSGINTFGEGLVGFHPGYVDFGQPRTFMGVVSVQY